ncbi:MAG: ABC transporter permease [Lachnospiraceae bacterium]|nr:ABC transporter permease [Lachnospiraceae bacterium]
MNKNKRYSDIAVPCVVIIIFLIIWQLVCTFELVPSYMLPSPVRVVRAFINDFPLLMQHAKTTLIEAVIGMVLGVLLGFVSAAFMDAFKVVRQGLYPILVLTQTIPPVAIAPLLILWFSYGMAPKVVLVVLVSYFPVAVGLLEGFQSVDADLIYLMKSMNANKWQIFWHVKFPSALGELFSGLKIAASYSIVGAVIAEWLGGFSGLGVYMTRVKKSMSYDKMFAVIFFVSAISLILMAFIKLLQYKLMPWKHVRENDTK